MEFCQGTWYVWTDLNCCAYYPELTISITNFPHKSDLKERKTSLPLMKIWCSSPLNTLPSSKFPHSISPQSFLILSPFSSFICFNIRNFVFPFQESSIRSLSLIRWVGWVWRELYCTFNYFNLLSLLLYNVPLRNWGQLLPWPWSLPWCPLICSSRNWTFTHRCPLRKENFLWRKYHDVPVRNTWLIWSIKNKDFGVFIQLILNGNHFVHWIFYFQYNFIS